MKSNETCLDQDGNNLVFDGDRVKVCYIGDSETIKVIRAADGEVLKTEPFKFNFTEFVNKARKYAEICNRK